MKSVQNKTETLKKTNFDTNNINKYFLSTKKSYFTIAIKECYIRTISIL